MRLGSLPISTMSCFLFALACTMPSVARADVVAPPTGCNAGEAAVDECSVAALEQPGTTCEECTRGYDDDRCDQKYQGTAFEKVCENYPVGHGSQDIIEIWCDGPTQGSGGAAWRTATGLGLVAVAIMVLVPLRRRRSMRSQD